MNKQRKFFYNEDPHLYKATYYTDEDKYEEYYFPALNFDDAVEIAKDYCSLEWMLDSVVCVSPLYFERDYEAERKANQS